MRVIDFSSHMVPPTLANLLIFHDTRKASEYDPAYRLKTMNKYNIEKQVISLSAAWLYGLDSEKAITVCKLANDYIFMVTQSDSKRFVGCGILDLRNIESALDEAERVVKKLNFNCITIATHQGEKSLDDMYFYQLYEFAERENVPIFIHPISFDGYSLVNEKDESGSMQVFGWPFETSWAIWRMIVSGVFDRFRKLKIVTHHLGGMLPHFFNRAKYRFERNRNKKAIRSYSEYFKQIYADTALDGASVTSLMEGYEVFGSRNIVFGSDWPFIDESLSYRKNIEAISALPIPEKEKDEIFYENAKRLLSI
jgi:aminocarboxymuconate-semialdehyde decarboxylase